MNNTEILDNVSGFGEDPNTSATVSSSSCKIWFIHIQVYQREIFVCLLCLRWIQRQLRTDMFTSIEANHPLRENYWCNERKM